jgi:hypothetical protein
MGGVWTRLKLACAAFFTILFKGRLPAALSVVRPPEPAAAAAPPPPSEQSDGAIQILALMQRDGRLIDFLMEDLTVYDDAQIGVGVRDVHAACRGVLTRYVTLEPVLAGKEGEPTSVSEGVDPAVVRLVGNVTGQPPFSGRLLHRGWQATKVELPPLGVPGGRRIVAQAEIEVA